MLARAAFEYVVIRIVPRVERGECLNAGVMVICRPTRFLEARVLLDRDRLVAFAPFLDDETIELIGCQLNLIPRICKGAPDAGPDSARDDSGGPVAIYSAAPVRERF